MGIWHEFLIFPSRHVAICFLLLVAELIHATIDVGVAVAAANRSFSLLHILSFVLIHSLVFLSCSFTTSSCPSAGLPEAASQADQS